MKTDWLKIAIKAGSIDPKTNIEIGGKDVAQKALEEALGNDWIRETVKHALAFKKGSELAMNCLRLLCSEKATIYAYQIYQSEQGQKAIDAVWLIQHISNSVSLKWIEEFLNDENVSVCGIGVLDQLLYNEKISYDEFVENLLHKAECHAIENVREQAEFMRRYLKKGSDFL